MRMLTWIAAIAMVATISSFSMPDSKPPKKVLRHAVLLKFKDTSTSQQIKQVEDAFRQLPAKIKEIKGFEWGTNNSPEGLDQGFTHLFFVSFENEAGRAIYLPHPSHKEFVAVLEPHLDKVLVFDYWTQQ